MIAYKFLTSDGAGVFTGFQWPLPADGPGAWVEADIDPCRSGIHACRPDQLPLWTGRVLYEIQLDGEVVEDATKLVASRARLIRRVQAWDDSMRDRYTRACADRAHDLVGQAAPNTLDGWAAVIEPSIPEGPALLGFVAARIAEEIGGPEAYHAERARQADWLAEQLGIAR